MFGYLKKNLDWKYNETSAHEVRGGAWEEKLRYETRVESSWPVTFALIGKSFFCSMNEIGIRYFDDIVATLFSLFIPVLAFLELVFSVEIHSFASQLC